MTNKNIYMNLGGLDPELIMKAAPAEKVQKKKSRTWVKWASLAACLCIIITASILVLPDIIDDIRTGEAKPVYIVGESVKGEYGTLTLTEENPTEYRCTFLLEKTTDAPICFAFRGHTILREYLDENGAILQEVQTYHIITPYNNFKEAASNHIVADDKLVIMVNGEKVDTLPTAPGTYEITIDYSELDNLLDHFEPFVDVIGFDAWIIIDKSAFGK